MKQTVEYTCDGGHQYEHVAPSVAAQVLGTAGSVGDYLTRLIITVTTAATSTVTITDGGLVAHTITPANTPIGVYSVLIGARSADGAWKVTTGAGVEVLAVGQFSV